MEKRRPAPNAMAARVAAVSVVIAMELVEGPLAAAIVGVSVFDALSGAAADQRLVRRLSSGMTTFLERLAPT